MRSVRGRTTKRMREDGDGDVKGSGSGTRSQVFWMALQAGDHILNRLSIETDLVHSRKQGEPEDQCKCDKDITNDLC